jgi:hypothetical protein
MAVSSMNGYTVHRRTTTALVDNPLPSKTLNLVRNAGHNPTPGSLLLRG